MSELGLRPRSSDFISPYQKVGLFRLKKKKRLCDDDGMMGDGEAQVVIEINQRKNRIFIECLGSILLYTTVSSWKLRSPIFLFENGGLLSPKR